ncbi:MAG: hypothetical protein ACI4RO_05495, partial [Candidatus Scatosoma sp.]
KYFERREDLSVLILSEFIEGKGRFFDAIIDLVWAICEETSWVLPAHYWMIDENTNLPDSMFGNSDYIKEPIDLYAAVTAANLALVYGLFNEQLEEYQPLILRRIERELEWRVWEPFTCEKFLPKLWWTGVDGRKTNNWCPWIISNLLTACLFSVKDGGRRETLLSRLTSFLDSFIDGYGEDGGCDEGACYWEMSVGILFICFELLYEATDGKFNPFGYPLLKKMGEFICSIHINKFNYLNFSDADLTLHIDVQFFYRYAEAVNSEKMKNLANYLFQEEEKLGNAYSLNGGYFYNPKKTRLYVRPFNALKLVNSKPFYVVNKKEEGYKREFLENLQLFCARDKSNGFYLSLNGGNNAQSHNHNDIGNVTIMYGDHPIFIDVGGGKYTKRTFDYYGRYTLWNNRSDGHNLPDLNGKVQLNGKDYYARNFKLTENGNGCTVELTNAYPKDADLSFYGRRAELGNESVVICDKIKFNHGGNADFHFICIEKPVLIEKNKIKISNAIMVFDESLNFDFEILDCSEEEYSTIPEKWGTENIYRINLRNANFLEKEFVFYLKSEMR